ncbi:MAG: hypothetical protein WCJ35_21320 [Planctomycetota bacterium]
MILFECPYCAAQLEIGESRTGRSMTCPFCKGQVEIPKPHKPRRLEEYDLQEDDGRPRDSLATLGKLTAADIEELEKDEEPQKKKRRRPKMEWQLFVGGFGFPWSPGAVMQWLMIAIWATAAGWLTHSAINLRSQQALGDANINQTILALLANMGSLMAGVALAGIAAIHGMTILLETTAGNDRVENWPNVGLFLDWVGDLWFIFNTATVSVALGLGLDWLLPGLLATREWTVAVTVFFAFPILLLCTLESGSPFLPVSSVVFASLGRHGIAWLTFYLQAGSLLAAVVAMVYYFAPWLDLRLAIPLAALLFSAAVMIFFRLLGRLAFYCSVEPEEEEAEE